MLVEVTRPVIPVRKQTAVGVAKPERIDEPPILQMADGLTLVISDVTLSGS